jgi:hypothetical protein
VHVSRRQIISVVYETVRIQTGFHADLLVEDQVIETIAPVHKNYLLPYLKLAGDKGAIRTARRAAFSGPSPRKSLVPVIGVPTRILFPLRRILRRS